MMNDRETRALPFEVRAEQNEEYGHYLNGRPIVFEQETDLGFFREVIDSHALDKTDMRDVRFLVGHNTSGIPLARSRNNNARSTMQFTVEPGEGMDIRVNLDVENNTEAKALYSATERGDISGMSFMFCVDGEAWEDLETEKPLRRVTSISRIFEVSAVAFPAYEATSLEARSGETLDSVRAALESARAKAAEERAAKEQAEQRTVLLAKLRGESHE